MSHRALIAGRSELSKELSRDARDAQDLLIVEQLLNDSVSKPRLPDPPMEVGESFGDNQEPKSIFICGRCDMIVHEEDRVCEFCGAEFEDADSEGGDGERTPLIDRPLVVGNDFVQSPAPFVPRALSQVSSAEKVDVVSMLNNNRSRLGVEHLAGGSTNSFLSQARMLRAIEGMISEAGEFGVETGEARRTLLAAWKASHEGKWSRAMQLADESRRSLAPGVTNLIEGQLLCLRGAIIEMKRKGRSVTPLIIKIKTIQKELSEMRLDDAMRSTKAIVLEIKKIQMHILDDIGSEEVTDEGHTAYHGQGI